MSTTIISGQLIDLHQRRIYPAELQISNGIIISIQELPEAPMQYIMPGFVDAHVHIESSMLPPAAFAGLAVVHGTVATISDPHEIANVCGIAGVQWMIDNARQVPFKCHFGAPSCVPATIFETAGAVLDAPAVDTLLQSPDIWYLTEVMNYPGVLNGDPEVLAKIGSAQKYGKPVDGHAPGLRGEQARSYAAAGISTDHECSVLEEALDKLDAGMHILIREGSAAKNFEALHSLLSTHPDRVMFCSDDKHPDDLLRGHINELVKRAIQKGHSLFDVLRAACLNPVRHYGIPVGLLQVGDPADFIILNDLNSWIPSKTFIQGECIASDGKCLFQIPEPVPINSFQALRRSPNDLIISADHSEQQIRLIKVHDGLLTTSAETAVLNASGSYLESDTIQDILKLVVINRYEPAAIPACAFINGFSFQKGAIASTVAHDCHNIIAVGVDDESICAAINAVIDAQGGISVALSADEVSVLALPIAGLMSDQDSRSTGHSYARLSLAAKGLGSQLAAPFMSLSFMALLVIPELKLSDKGLFDGQRFEFCPLLYTAKSARCKRI